MGKRHAVPAGSAGLRQGKRMADAFVLEVGSITAGIVVRQRRGVLFYASESRLYTLDGKTYRSIADARLAVAELLRAQNSAPRHGVRREAA